MITEQEYQSLKQVLGGRYTRDVLAILSRKNITNQNGEPHNPKYIRMVFQGIRENLDIEQALLELAEEKTTLLQYQKDIKENLFN